MPYLSENEKELISKCGRPPINAGELTYAIQQQIKRYLDHRRQSDAGVRYADLAVVMGSLEGARFDFEMRVVEPYERAKREINGDVW